MSNSEYLLNIRDELLPEIRARAEEVKKNPNGCIAVSLYFHTIIPLLDYIEYLEKPKITAKEYYGDYVINTDVYYENINHNLKKRLTD